MLHSKTRIDHSGQKLTEIELGTLEKNEKVTELILSNNLLREAPLELSQVFPNVVVLKLDKNHFQSVPPFITVVYSIIFYIPFTEPPAVGGEDARECFPPLAKLTFIAFSFQFLPAKIRSLPWPLTSHHFIYSIFS